MCGATECINGPLSNLLTEILTVVGDLADTDMQNALSTEEVMGALMNLNTRSHTFKKLVLVSMDVDSMFPRLNRDKVACVVAEEFIRSGLKVEVDSVELGLYLAVAYQDRRGELEALGLAEVVQKRKFPRARKVTVTTKEFLERGGDGAAESRFNPPERQATEAETKQMFALALKVAVKACLENHCYSLGTDWKRQAGGGAIGLKLTGAIAKVFMVWWCRRFGQTIRAATVNVEFELYLHMFYVDDHNLAMEELPPGSRYRDGRVEIVPEEVDDDCLLPGDQRTALVMKEVANSICEFTSFKTDCPSANASGWMPLLDIQSRVEPNNQISWKYFEKNVTSPFTILNSSALPNKVKRMSLIQEGLRRLRNTCPALIPTLKQDLMEGLAEKMMLSGYPEELRAGVIRDAVVGYERLLAACGRGERPLYRPRTWQQQERRKAKLLKRVSWYRPADAVLFLPATPDGELAEMARKVVDEEAPRLGLRIRVVEKGGISLKRALVRTDLAAGDPCKQTDCQACLSNPGEGGGLLHQRSGALYRGTCKLCAALGRSTVYHGESGYNGYTRLGDHGGDIRTGDLSNAFAKHLLEDHPEATALEVQTAINFEILRTFDKPLERQVAEAVAIQNCKADLVLNSKAEWEQPAVERLIVTRELPDQEERRGGMGRGRRQRGAQQ